METQEMNYEKRFNFYTPTVIVVVFPSTLGLLFCGIIYITMFRI